MTDADLLGGVMLLAVVAYGVLGGADFGGGIWDLFAGGPRQDRQRHAIAEAMGPVWEANHVWLIFVIVLLFAGFPPAYAALGVALFVPFHLALVGITLRGAAFVFRKYAPASPAQRRWGVVFGAASVITPVLLGMCLGAVSIEGLRLWRPLPLAMGLLALALCAYLAAVFLCAEVAGGGSHALAEDFRRRALLSGTVVVALSALALPLCALRAPHLWHGLWSPRALPVLAGGGGAALLSGLALLRRWYPVARAAAVAQVGCLLLGWGLAQYPYLIYPDLRIQEARAEDSALRFILWTLPPGLCLLLPSLWLLFRVFKRAPQAN